MIKKHNILTANQAVAKMAYKTNEVFPIYPITPASEMSELVEQWSAERKQNMLNTVPTAFEMQSEAGVAGAMHGALQTGSLSSTFTASQGLLLMLPNMYKIAGELTPNVIHVATRSIATHALSVFGDHSDIMAVRQSGYAFLGSASAQEAQDFALIAQAATLKSRVPFVHFFDGFRTSHELNTIETISDNIITKIIESKLIAEHRNRSLNPNNPVLRGTSQGADVFFQSREAQNSFYNACPDIVQNKMDEFAKLTGRAYNLFDYVGHPEAEHIIISMASSTETIETTINQLNKNGNRYGLIKVRLFRPFSTDHLIKALPKTVKCIAVLDRTKEPGSTGEPLYLDIVQSLSESFQTNTLETFPRIVGGRYGLSSKEFTPSMVNAIFENLKLEHPKNNFTVGINDDITNLSLDISKKVELNSELYQAVFYQKKCRENTQGLNNTMTIIANNLNSFVQGYIDCDYKKSNSRNVVHLRLSRKEIKAPYLIEKADFIACENANFIKKYNVIKNIKSKGTLLVNSSLTSKAFWQAQSINTRDQIRKKELNVYVVNFQELQSDLKINSKEISEAYACFLALKNDALASDDIIDLKEYIYKVDTSNYKTEYIGSEPDSEFSKTLLGQLLANNGNDIPVSMLPVDGTYPTNTSQYNSISQAEELPIWNTDLCTQCGACSMACPQGSLRIKVYDDSNLEGSSSKFKHIFSEEFDLMNFTIQNNPDQCNGCNNCVDACPAKALTMKPISEVYTSESENWNHFKNIPEFDREKINIQKVSQQQLQEPLFKYSIGVEGCGEAPYLKLVSQLFGDRLMVANATGASSIFGGALPTTPWSKNKNGEGPAWSNSLFEDNAEFGLGYRLSINQQEQQAKVLLKKLVPEIKLDLVHDILNATQNSEEEISKQKNRVALLKKQLTTIASQEAVQLLNIADCLVEKSIWIIGGDGWAYDIGYGGLDHVIASGENVNILILDNEVYDNTGGQASKATPFGASGKFAFSGKQKQKKDLGRLAMTYDKVYVASVAIGANQEQTLKAFNEAESFNGPSIIIAYTHSSSHGINMKNPSQYHKAAVDSGQWILYSNDPRKEHPFQLDSGTPTIHIESYLNMEKRFSKLFQDKKVLASRIKEIQKQVNKRYDWCKELSIKSPVTKI
ncbi:4Fe-4S binding protein [Ichthyenterobacterium sp. W332]|uniref:4Fe-4S binding protein n=1 Tax=Microcosmobacter mediterraneus TaxID=3075607 RepID=A0ABU2YHW3_9FLAO|nr:4Fe-4S binding protein [Ichthyenterobacterium sp. W332]MDT0557402.1 4Fe-4S binding protein [Ichthyenterobacterium sp. W332]